AVSRLMESMAADEDFEPNQDSSFSEDELLPRRRRRSSSVSERSSPPAPVQCLLDKDSLVDGLRVLIPMDDQLLYAGHVNTVHSPDIYSVVVEGERGNRPHIYCLEQLLQEAIIDVKPPSVHCLPEVTRIAAYWSQQYRCLYPGTVVNGSSDIDEKDDLITVEFDDGDTGRIPLSHIRLLPPDYKIHCGAEPSPALLVSSCSRKRVRKCSKDAGTKPGDSPLDPEKADPPPSSTQTSERPQAPGKASQERSSSVQEKVQSASRPSLGGSTSPTSAPTAASAERAAAWPVPAAAGLRPDPASPHLLLQPSSKPSSDHHSSPRPGTIPRAPTGKPASTVGPRPSSLSSASSSSSVPRPKLKMASDQLTSRPRPGCSSSPTEVGVRRKPTSAELLVKLDHEGVTSPKTKKTKALMLLEGRGVRPEPTPIMAASQKPPKAKMSDREAGPPEEESGYKAAALSKEKAEKSGRPESSSSSESEEDIQKGNPKKKKKKCTSSYDSSSSSDEERPPTPPVGPGPSPPALDNVKEEVKEDDEEEAKPEERTNLEEEELSPASDWPSSPPASPAKPTKPAKGSGQRGRPPKPKPGGAEGKVGRPKRREGLHLPTTKELANVSALPSVENRPKISAFLPARQLWKWFGKPTQRRGMKGKAKKLFYKAIVRGREMIRIGDCAVFLSAGRPNLPFIGRIQSMWESWGSNMVVRVNWFYHPEETNPGKKLTDKKRALYQSSHSDENDVQTISHKCLVVGVDEYEQMSHSRRYADSEDLYYLAGTYEPTTGMIFSTEGVPVIC
uniref:BAH domain-containing protein n=1 Tax=Tetraodon nigroviridis TaxID=99883 RepID=H3CDH1_TETNG